MLNLLESCLCTFKPTHHLLQLILHLTHTLMMLSNELFPLIEQLHLSKTMLMFITHDAMMLSL